MSKTIEWYVQDRLIYCLVQGDLSIEEWRDISQRLAQYIREGEAPVHVILDMLEMKKHPINPKQIIEATVWLREPQLGWLTHLTTQPLVKMLASITLQTFHTRYRTVDSINTALDFLARTDIELAPAIQALRENE